MTPTLFTASWSTLHLADAAGVLWAQPVRTSRGLPRFWPESEAFPTLGLLMPEFWMFGVWAKDRDKGDRCYRRKLHIAGLPAVKAALDSVDTDKPLALACFESDQSNCHRGRPHGFAGWYERKTGVVVPELALLHGLGGGVALVYEVSGREYVEALAA